MSLCKGCCEKNAESARDYLSREIEIHSLYRQDFNRNSLYRQDLTFYYSVKYSDQGAHSETVTKVFTVWKISQVTSDQVANKPSDK